MLPTDWRAWAFIAVAVFVVMFGLVLIARIFAGARGRVKVGNTSVITGGEVDGHDCKQEGLLRRIVTSLDLLMAGQVAQLDFAIKQGANGNTREVKDAIAKNASAWQEFLIKKGVEA